MTGWVCTFTITHYGHSGNELPPPACGGFSYSLLSIPSDTEKRFNERMQDIGMHIRNCLEKQFKESPMPYTTASSCSWSITPAGSMTDLFDKVWGRTWRNK